MNVSSDCFIKTSFDYLSKNGKRNVMSSEMHYLSIVQGLTLSPENYQVFL